MGFLLIFLRTSVHNINSYINISMVSIYIHMYIVLTCWDVLTKHLKNNELTAPGSRGWGVQEQHAAEPQSGEDSFSV